MEAILAQYGYPLLILGTLLEGETVLLLAGLLSKVGFFQLPWVMVIAALTGFAGEGLFYTLGRFWGNSLLTRWKRMALYYPIAQSFTKRYGVLSIFLVQFLYGLRYLGALSLGMTAMRAKRFLCFNLVANALWAVAVGGMGYAFGEVLEVVVGDVGEYQVMAVLILLTLGVIYAIGHILWERHRRALMNQEDWDA